jgi:hypothetical protein
LIPTVSVVPHAHAGDFEDELHDKDHQNDPVEDLGDLYTQEGVSFSVAHKDEHVDDNDEDDERLEVDGVNEFIEDSFPFDFRDEDFKFGLLGAHLCLELDPQSLRRVELTYPKEVLLFSVVIVNHDPIKEVQQEETPHKYKHDEEKRPVLPMGINCIPHNIEPAFRQCQLEHGRQRLKAVIVVGVISDPVPTVVHTGPLISHLMDIELLDKVFVAD